VRWHQEKNHKNNFLTFFDMTSVKRAFGKVVFVLQLILDYMGIPWDGRFGYFFKLFKFPIFRTL